MAPGPLAPPHAALRLGAHYLLSAACGWLFQTLTLPLPWMLGPLLGTALLFASGLVTRPIPPGTRPGGQMIVALQIASYFTPAAVLALAGQAPLILSVVALSILAAALVAGVTARRTGRPLRQMFLATAPFSPVEATVIAERHGWSPGPIVLAQTLRMGIAVLAFPLALYAIDGWPAPAALAPSGRALHLPSVLLMLALGIAGAALFRRLGWTNPYFLGPLLLAALATAAGLPTQGFPLAVVGAAQVVLGTWLGSVFRRDVFLETRRHLPATLAATLGFLALVTAGAIGLALLFGLPWEAVVLGAAPGGVTEMALTAGFLGIDVTLVTGMQMARILILMTGMRALLHLLARWERG